MTGGLSIGDAARRLRVSVQALRAWTRRYGYPPSWRTKGGHRRFPLADIDRLAVCLEKNKWDVRTSEPQRWLRGKPQIATFRVRCRTFLHIARRGRVG